MDKLLTCAKMLDSLIVAYVQFKTMLIELKKVLSLELQRALKELLIQKVQLRNV